VFNSDKGRIMTAADVAGGYEEPVMVGGPPTWQASDRSWRDVALPAAARLRVVRGRVDRERVHGRLQHCQDHPDSAMFANMARAAMPDIDAVTMATPPADTEQTVMFSVPPEWPDGEYVAYLESIPRATTTGPTTPTPSRRRSRTTGTRGR
jgi:hypothetical protein